MMKRTFYLVVIYLCTLTIVIPNISHAAGYQWFKLGETNFGLWYPTDEKTKTHYIGPFETEIAYKAEPKTGTHPIIVFSHGFAGRFRNHHITAAKLADAGYFVIAPDHSADYLLGGDENAGVLLYRVQELKQILDALKDSNTFSKYLSKGPVHGIGYSLGAATILLGAGAKLDLELARIHCNNHGAQDNLFCNVPLIHRIFRFFQAVRSNISLPETGNQFQIPSFIDGKLILVAPVSRGLEVENQINNQDILIVPFLGDEIAKPYFHSTPLYYELIPHNRVLLKSYPAHHFAFISPFPISATAKEYIPVAKDPVKFDRRAFIDKVVTQVLDFLHSQ